MTVDVGLLDTRQAAELLGLRPAALAAWRQRGDGPPYIRISSRCVRYDPGDLTEWLDERREGPAEPVEIG